MDVTAASDSDGEPEAKHQRRYSPRRSDMSPPRRRSAYRDERLDPRDHSNHHNRQAPAPLLPYPYSGDWHDPRVAMAHNPYGPPPWSPPDDPHRYQPYFGRHPRDR